MSKLSIATIDRIYGTMSLFTQSPQPGVTTGLDTVTRINCWTQYVYHNNSMTIGLSIFIENLHLFSRTSNKIPCQDTNTKSHATKTMPMDLDYMILYDQ